MNSAIAIRAGKQRITYQPNLNGEPDPSGLQLRIDGKPVRLTAAGIPLNTGGRIIQTSAAGGIQVEPGGGTVLIITPGWWDHYKVWYLNIDSRHVRATDGLMGLITAGNWLPALPDGKWLGPMPSSLTQRYHDLYEVFGNAWRVHDTTSLFDYAPGTSTKTFTNPSWPGGDSTKNCIPPDVPGGIKPQRPIPKAEAEKICGEIKDGNRRSNCVLDVMATGETGFGKTYVEADKINNNAIPDAPVLTFPDDFKTGLTMPVKFEWTKSKDADGDPITYKLVVWPVNDGPNNNNATLVGGTPAWWKRQTGCTALAGLAGLLLFFLLFFLGMRRKPGLLLLVLLLILLGVAATYYFCGRANKGSTTATMMHEFANLESGKAYYWKVIADDGKGGSSESVIRRIEIK
ncbi:hypothetical protein [Paraflavitalea speifideaquila]|uniref:hypothetical protein n=1 Tax=Paraflavitalea speifideaquila TaxID=3076558 RepID=UPI0028ED0902|nr:hypothetical protein [Paraflavitalea speifideiaquila]